MLKTHRVFIALALLLVADAAAAQQSAPANPFANGMGNAQQPGQNGQRMGAGGLGASPALGRALDKDQDGELSADEIRAAAASVAALDLNHDGKVTRDELRAGSGFAMRQPGMMGNRPGQGAAGGAAGAGAGAAAPGGGAMSLADRMMKNDKNGDGILTQDEMPKPLQQMVGKADANGDGALSRAEIDSLAKTGVHPGAQPGAGMRGREQRSADRAGEPAEQPQGSAGSAAE